MQRWTLHPPLYPHLPQGQVWVLVPMGRSLGAIHQHGITVDVTDEG